MIVEVKKNNLKPGDTFQHGSCSYMVVGHIYSADKGSTKGIWAACLSSGDVDCFSMDADVTPINLKVTNAN